MGKHVFLIICLCLLSTTIVSAQSCLTSSEDYALEVVLTDYNLFNLRKLTGETATGFILPAEYSSDLLAIVKETTFPEGLSVRIQIPTQNSEISQPHLKFVSSSTTGELREVDINSFGTWGVSCVGNECEFEKEKRKVSVEQVGSQQEVTVEITEELAECDDSCSGVCFAATTSSRCIDGPTRHDIETLLRYFAITDNFEDLFDSYRIVGSETITLSDIEPATSPFINWQEAMRQQLVFLNNRGVLELTRDEVESIVALAKRGQAGQNYRIVYDFQNESWMYYDKTTAPILTNQRDCTAYAQIEVSEVRERVEAESVINTFYLIPIIIVGGGLISLIVLIIIGRVISARNGHEKQTKPQLLKPVNKTNTQPYTKRFKEYKSYTDQ